MKIINRLEYYDKTSKFKLLLIFIITAIIIISAIITFIGLTSAYVISKSRPDWLKDFQLPNAFLFSTIAMLVSSFTFYSALQTMKKGIRNQTSILLLSTLALGITFIVLQFKGFEQVIENGYFFTGSESNVRTSFLYISVLVHIAFLFWGKILLLMVIYNHYKQKYNSTQTLGIELSAMYWHFMDFIWVYLFLFFYFFK
jgi:cytochrome c oxidase subunit 3